MDVETMLSKCLNYGHGEKGVFSSLKESKIPVDISAGYGNLIIKGIIEEITNNALLVSFVDEPTDDSMSEPKISLAYVPIDKINIIVISPDR